MWFSVLAGSNEPLGCESGSGNTDVEGSSSLKDSAGWEAFFSDWPGWNLLGKKKKKSGNGTGWLKHLAIRFTGALKRFQRKR